MPVDGFAAVAVQQNGFDDNVRPPTSRRICIIEDIVSKIPIELQQTDALSRTGQGRSRHISVAKVVAK
jgi:hypothetical protein